MSRGFPATGVPASLGFEGTQCVLCEAGEPLWFHSSSHPELVAETEGVPGPSPTFTLPWLRAETHM